MVRLYPGSDPNVLQIVGGSCSDTYPGHDTDLWIDIEVAHIVTETHPLFNNVERLFFYDWFHAPSKFTARTLDKIRYLSQRYPTKWITTNAKPIPGIQHFRFDYLWNQIKSATLDRSTGWKHCSDPRAYQRSELFYNNRNKKYLSLNRSMNDYRKKLLDLLKEHDGYFSDSGKNIIIPNMYVSDSEILNGVVVPPDQSFFDDSYVSCQIESQYLGSDSVIFTEKTYDHLIRGRFVLNFGPKDYYKCLENDGWKLPKKVDFGWDQESDDYRRFQAYLGCLDSILKKPLDVIHTWFVDNCDVIDHNYQMLVNKPYDTIDRVM